MKKNYIFLKKWKKEMKEQIKLVYPNMDDKKINNILDKKIRKKLKNTECRLYNNYLEKEMITSLLDVTEFFYTKHPIPTASGVFYKRHDEADSPSNKMVADFIAKRDIYKKTMYSYLNKADTINDKIKNNKDNMSDMELEIETKQMEENLYQFRKYDRLQSLEKVKANSFYGASGLKVSVFYNLHTALSTTTIGQVLISVAAMAFEMFLENNVKFYNLDECLLFINNIKKEKDGRKFKDKKIINNVTQKQVLNRLKDTFMYIEDYTKHEKTLIKILSHMNQENLNRIYYKNNIYDFFRNKYPNTILKNTIMKIDSFRNPNKIPKEIKKDLEDLYALVQEYVFYNYEIYDRINRLKYHKRKSVTVVDTDSNFINIDWWYKFCLKEVVDEYDMYEKLKTLQTKHEEEIFNNVNNNIDIDELNNLKNTVNDRKYTIINILTYILTNMINDVLYRYAKNANIQDYGKAKLLNMKNEFLLDRLLVTTSKKNYASIQLLKEGNVIPFKNQLDVKGLDLMKSVVTEHTSVKLKIILEKLVLRKHKIEIPLILQELEKFETEIRTSILNREKKYLKPISVSEIEKYDDPYREQRVRAIIIWNDIFPKQSISLPTKTYLIKLKTSKIENLLPLRETNNELFNIIKDRVFNSDIAKIKAKGLDVIAIPRDLNNIPEWMIPFIDYDNIINDNVSKFIKILYSVGLKKIQVKATDKFYSNIVEF